MSCLGVELGSTRIKAVKIDKEYSPVSSGDYTWASEFKNGIWTYDIKEAWTGLKAALGGIENLTDVEYVAISGMMHGYLAFDENWNLLVPFRTWQNTITAKAAAELTELLCLRHLRKNEKKMKRLKNTLIKGCLRKLMP